MNLVRWLGKNLGTLLTASILAVVVWVSAVTATNPNEEDDFPRPLAIEIRGKDAGLMLMGSLPSSAVLRLEAPRSVWTQLAANAGSVQVWVDLSTLEAGTHTVPVQVQIGASPVRLISVVPQEITLTLERVVTVVFPVNFTVSGSPAPGYEAKTLSVEPLQVTVSGPESKVVQVQGIYAGLDISGASAAIETTIPLSAQDSAGAPVTGITISPAELKISQKIDLLGGYRNVIVKVVPIGQLVSGYKITNIFVTPPNVIVFAADPQLLEALPGYIETHPLDLTGAEDDIEALLELNLPAGVSVVGDAKVLVQVSIAAIESNLSISLPVELTGLRPGFQAHVEPAEVDVILTGPIPALNALKAADIRVKVDLAELGVGVHLLEPEVELLPPGVQVVSVLPQSVDVTISRAPTSTPTPTPTLEPTPTGTPPTPTPTGTLPTPTPTNGVGLLPAQPTPTPTPSLTLTATPTPRP